MGGRILGICSGDMGESKGVGREEILRIRLDEKVTRQEGREKGGRNENRRRQTEKTDMNEWMENAEENKKDCRVDGACGRIEISEQAIDR